MKETTTVPRYRHDAKAAEVSRIVGGEDAALWARVEKLFIFANKTYLERSSNDQRFLRDMRKAVDEKRKMLSDAQLGYLAGLCTDEQVAQALNPAPASTKPQAF